MENNFELQDRDVVELYQELLETVADWSFLRKFLEIVGKFFNTEDVCIYTPSSIDNFGSISAMQLEYGSGYFSSMIGALTDSDTEIISRALQSDEVRVFSSDNNYFDNNYSENPTGREAENFSRDAPFRLALAMRIKNGQKKNEMWALIIGLPDSSSLETDTVELIKKKGRVLSLAAKAAFSIRSQFHQIRKRNDELEKSESMLDELQRRLQALSDVSPVGMFRADSEGGVLYVNQVWMELTGLSHIESLSYGWTDTLHPEDKSRVIRTWKESFRNQRPFRMEYRFLKPDGEISWVFGQSQAERDEHGEVIGFIGTVTDITELKIAEEEIRRQAYHDSLTGLYNRSYLRIHLSQELALAKRNNTSLAVIFLDLDRFKTVNDSLGHAAGDSLLREAASRIANCLREADTIARQGGDEFIIVLPGIESSYSPLIIAQKILNTLQEKYTYETHEIYLSASIGIAVYPESGETGEILLRNADAAMYAAKNRGRNCFQYYTESLNVSSFERLKTESLMRRGLEKDQFIIYYQPRLSLLSGQIHGMEALMRWRNDEGQWIGPEEFIPIAEETGMIMQLGDLVLREALRFCRRARTHLNNGIKVAVNLSPRQFQQANLHEAIRQIISQEEADASWLELEITEGAMMQEPEQALATLNELSRMGAEICIDDFGTGYSSLSYLKRFPIDVLKIDRSFINGIPDNAEDTAICSAIIAMSRSLNIRVVAEGTETLPQIHHLDVLACDEIQGYYFARPMDADKTLEFLEGWSPEKFLIEKNIVKSQ